jgi:hypothetical protein
MPYREAREFAAGLFPEKDLMTYRGGWRALTRLARTAKGLDTIKYTRNDDDQEAKGVMDDVLLSPLLSKMFSKPLPRWFLSGSTIIAHLDRKEIGDDDAKVITNILIAKFKGQIVVPDFGFCGRDHHAAVIREERLIAGVYTLSELPEKLRDRAMLMPKVGKGCTYKDAEVLAQYKGLRPDTSHSLPFTTQTTRMCCQVSGSNASTASSNSDASQTWPGDLG